MMSDYYLSEIARINEENRRLTAENTKLQIQCNTSRKVGKLLKAENTKLREVQIKSADIEAGKPMEGFEALPTQTQWDVAFSTALLAVESLFIDSQEQE